MSKVRFGGLSKSMNGYPIPAAQKDAIYVLLQNLFLRELAFKNRGDYEFLYFPAPRLLRTQVQIPCKLHGQCRATLLLAAASEVHPQCFNDAKRIDTRMRKETFVL